MKKILSLAFALSLLAATAQAETIRANINGLVCSFCATGIEKTFRKQQEVETVKVDLENKLVTVGTKLGQTMDDAIVTKLITDAGYSITNIKRDK